jgi:peptidoglycan/LPS O-acetylase OafA/YrhL
MRSHRPPSDRGFYFRAVLTGGPDSLPTSNNTPTAGNPRPATKSVAATGAAERPSRIAVAANSASPRVPGASHQPKFAELDGLRGLAALVVVLWHFAFAFAPERIGIIAPFDPKAGLVGSPAFALIDGPGAVILFFVLSGFVLPLAYFHSGRIDVVLRAAAKRWFRLVGLTFLAAVGSYLLFHFGLYHYREAAEFTQSNWLAGFGGGDVNGDLQPSLPAAALEGGVLAFLRDNNVYDPVLWTMRDELFGSLMTFGLAVLLWQRSLTTGAVLLGAAALATQRVDPNLLAFVVGLGLSWLHAQGRLQVRGGLAAVLLALGTILFGYLEPRGIYAPLGFLYDHSGWRYDRVWLHTIGSALLILGLLGSKAAGRLLASAGGRLLGRLSFPVYLFHFPLICSLSCWLFLAVRPSLPHQAALAVAAAGTVPALMLIAYAFARIDELWLTQVNRVAHRVVAAPGRA